MCKILPYGIAKNFKAKSYTFLCKILPYRLPKILRLQLTKNCAKYYPIVVPRISRLKVTHFCAKYYPIVLPRISRLKVTYFCANIRFFLLVYTWFSNIVNDSASLHRLITLSTFWFSRRVAFKLAFFDTFGSTYRIVIWQHDSLTDDRQPTICKIITKFRKS